MKFNMRYDKGFTFIELLVTLVLIGILASVVLPTASILTRQEQERELKQSLMEIRNAIDAYKVASDRNEIKEEFKTASGYPQNLKVLLGVPNQYGNKTIRFLRKIPKDPFSDTQVDAEKSWILRSYESEFNKPQEGNDIYDIYSSSNKNGLNGIPYRKW